MTINDLVQQRFGLQAETGTTVGPNEVLAGILNRRSCREYKAESVSDDLLETLFAAAFSAPSKSDLQQASVIQVKDREKQQRIAAMNSSIGWIARAPVFMVWCGDSRRIRRLSAWRKHAFANDHLDAFMNAAVDAGIAMQTFIIAAEAMGLGCCPVSQVRDSIEALSSELGLPEFVFPVAGLCVGWPAEETRISLRLPLSVTRHTDTYDDSELLGQVEAYDRRRELVDQTPPEGQRIHQRPRSRPLLDIGSMRWESPRYSPTWGIGSSSSPAHALRTVSSTRDQTAGSRLMRACATRKTRAHHGTSLSEISEPGGWL